MAAALTQRAVASRNDLPRARYIIIVHHPANRVETDHHLVAAVASGCRGRRYENRCATLGICSFSVHASRIANASIKTNSVVSTVQVRQRRSFLSARGIEQDTVNFGQERATRTAERL